MHDNLENYDSDTDDITPSNNLHENQLNYASTSSSSGWGSINKNNSSPVFNSVSFGINPDILETLHDGTPYDFFSLFVDDEVLNLLVTETNIYADDLRLTPRGPKSRLNKWVEVDLVEIKTFLGLVM